MGFPHNQGVNRYRREWDKLTSVFSARTRREKKEKKIACPILDVFACGQVSSPRLYRFKS